MRGEIPRLNLFVSNILNVIDVCVQLPFNTLKMCPPPNQLKKKALNKIKLQPTVNDKSTRTNKLKTCHPPYSH